MATVKPERNAGGNPYIEKGDGDEAVQAYIDAMPDWKQVIGRKVDALIDQHVDGVQKAVRWNTPFYGIEGQGWFLTVYCYKRYVQVGFLNGGQLDPLPPVASKQNNVRYLNIDKTYDLHSDQLFSWIIQSGSLRGQDVF